MSEQEQTGEEPYVVTRGKPPREYQFKPGQSGNPRGRPKGSKDLDALIDEELDRKVDVNLAGRQTKLTKRRVLARRLVDKAVNGDPKSIAICLEREKHRRGSSSQDNTAEIIAEDMAAFLSADEKILQDFLARNQKEDGHG